MKKEDYKLIPLSKTITQQIHGGLSLEAVLMIVEIPHAILIARESTNYIGKLWVEGCKGVDENDYFTKFFCGK